MSGIKRLGIVDVDKTLSDGYYIWKFAQYLVENKIFDEEILKSMERVRKKYERGKANYGHLSNRWVSLFGDGIRGEKEENLRELGENYIKTQDHGKFAFTDELISYLNENGFYTLAISNSPNLVIDPFAEEASIKDSMATAYNTMQGRFTGGVAETYIGNKRIRGQPDMKNNKMYAVRKFMKERGLPETILKKSAGFGDSMHDVFLLYVGYPFAVYPNKEFKEFLEFIDKDMVICKNSDILEKVKTKLDSSGLTINMFT